jgi:hypothetical protein
MLADTLYGSDENVQSSLEKDTMNLVSPVSAKEPKSEISICDFEIDEETNRVKVCRLQCDNSQGSGLEYPAGGQERKSS